MTRLSQTDIRILEQLGDFCRRRDIARKLGLSEGYVKNRVGWIRQVFELEHQPGESVRFALYKRWNSPLFRAGLEELGMLPPQCLTPGHGSFPTTAPSAALSTR